MQEVPEPILWKLKNVICHPGNLNRVIYALTSYEGNRKIPLVEQNLQSELGFAEITQQLADGTRPHEENVEYRKSMNEVWGDENVKKLLGIGQNDNLSSVRLRSAYIAAYIVAIRYLGTVSFPNGKHGSRLGGEIL